jgi:hypothetical protein
MISYSFGFGTSNSSFCVNTIIFNKLTEICPVLNLKGEDHKIFETCCSDFKNYLLYLHFNHLKIEDKDVPDCQEPTEEEGVPLTMFMGDVLGLYSELEKTTEIIDFIGVWLNAWWKKWQTRTKLVFDKSNLPKNSMMVGGGGMMNSNFTPQEREELKRVIVYTLIQNGDICCTEILTETILNKALTEGRVISLQDKLRLMTKLKRQTKAMTFVHGPLVFITMDNYYKIREFRNDTPTNIT